MEKNVGAGGVRESSRDPSLTLVSSSWRLSWVSKRSGLCKRQGGRGVEMVVPQVAAGTTVFLCLTVFVGLLSPCAAESRSKHGSQATMKTRLCSDG